MSQTSTDDLGFDPDELRQRYRDERDKRVRAEANEQYTEIKGEFAHYLEDPYIKFEERAPIVKEVQVAVKLKFEDLIDHTHAAIEIHTEGQNLQFTIQRQIKQGVARAPGDQTRRASSVALPM